MIDGALLKQNYHVLNDLQRAWYRTQIAPGWTPEQRFFFEGDLGLIGQMYLAERAALFQTVLEFKPRRVFEVGTWTGGGSTYFLASAFARLGAGEVVTLEAHRVLNAISQSYYRMHLAHLMPHVRFLSGADVSTAFSALLADGLECVFLDGAEDAEQTWEQYQFFSAYFRPGTILMAHDWDTAKMAKVRPVLQADPGWELLMHLTQPDSIGFVTFRRR